VVTWGGKLYALWEGGPPYRIDPTTLDTMNLETFGDTLTATTPFLAHTKLDAQRGRLVGLTSKVARSHTEFLFHEFDSTGAVVARTEAQLDGMSLLHDFAITPDYYVLMDNRIQPDLRAFLRYKLGRGPIIDALRTTPELPGRLLLVPRRPGRQPGQIIDLGGPLYSFHQANAWQEEGRVVLVSSVTDRLSFGQEFGYRGPHAALDPGVVEPSLPLQRFDIDPQAGTAKASSLGAYVIDFPRVHPRRDGLPTRYVFGASNSVPGLVDPFESLICADVQTGATAIYTPRPQRFVGEPIVVPRRSPPAASGEASESADGPVWVLAMLSDGQAGRTTLGIFAGDHIADGPVATVELPVLLPYGFHGAWADAAAC
jgi:carotenoid cleavage dioxygenase-like enzyme